MNFKLALKAGLVVCLGAEASLSPHLFSHSGQDGCIVLFTTLTVSSLMGIATAALGISIQLFEKVYYSR